MNNIIDAIMKARVIAFNEAIEANTVLINKEFGKVLPFSFEGQEIPPMICGLKAYISKDVPEELGFLMLKSKAIETAPAVDAVEVVHAKWVDRYGGNYANPLYECSECNEKALYKVEADALGNERIVQALTAVCPHCFARMDGE